MSRGVLVLLVVAAGLGLYLWLMEVPTEQKRAESDTIAKKLLDVKEEDVRAFTLTSSRDEMEVVREQDGRWVIRKPKPMEADAAAVDDFLRTLLLARVARVVNESATDLGDYGLATPSLTISIRLAAGTRTIRLGDAGPLSATLYAMREDAPQVLLTSLSGRDVLMKTIQEFRRRQAFPFDRNHVTRLKVVTPRETVVLYKEGHDDKETWLIKSPVQAAADQPEVKSLLIGLEDLKAQGFLDDPKERAATRAGLGRPSATFMLREGESDRSLSLFIDPRDRTLAYAEGTTQEPLYKISPAVVQDLAKGLFALRDKQLIASEPERVKTLVIKAGGQEFALTREGADWLVDGDPKLKADAARVNMFVTRVVRLQAERIVLEKPAALKPYGLVPPTVELIVAGDQGKPLGHVSFGRQEEGLVFALGSAMAGVFQVRPDILKDVPKRDTLIAGNTEPRRKEDGP